MMSVKYVVAVLPFGKCREMVATKINLCLDTVKVTNQS